MAKKRTRRGRKPQPEQNTVYFVTEDADQVIDAAAALTAVNRKQYHQTRNMRPLNYHIRAQCITLGSDSDPILFGTAPNTWTTKNAVVKLGAMYKRQLRENNLRISQLPKYGRELRLALGTDYGYTHGSGTHGYQNAALDATGAGKVFVPEDIAGADIMGAYTNSDGDSVTYANANDLTVLSIPQTAPDTEPKAVVAALTGTTDHSNNNLALIPEYLGSRRNSHDHVEVDSDLPEDTNLLLRLGSSSDEHFDDIIDAIEETGTFRPYDEAGANKIVVQGALMAAGDYTSFIAPLGLIKVTGNADSKFLFTVTAITEM